MKREENEDTLAERSGNILLAGNDDAEEADEDHFGDLDGTVQTGENGDELSKSAANDDCNRDIHMLPSSAHQPVSGDSDTYDDDGDRLISTIISPSPFPHHLAGPSSDRLRNALHRVASDPTRDTEAWSALLSEAQSSYRSLLPTLRHSESEVSDEGRKLDWIESCFGALLKHFPYASGYYTGVSEILMQQSAMPDEEEGGGEASGNIVEASSLTERQKRCERKLEWIFRFALGIEDSNNGISNKELKEGKDEDRNGKEIDLKGMCTSSVDLWLLYIRKRSRDANRAAACTGGDSNNSVRERTVAAYETALSHASFVHNNHLLWRQYLSYVKSWGETLSETDGTATDHTLQQMQKQSLRSIYQRLVSYPMTGIDQLWNEYETFERKQSEQLAQALIGDLLPKYQHSKSVYLERNRVYNVHELHVGRLATPPVDMPAELSRFSGITAGSGAAGSASTVASWDDYSAKMSEESMILGKWRRRCGYERTNPERLDAPALALRIRQSYREAVCAFTRHPEVWHEWAMWELLHSPSSGVSSTSNIGGISPNGGGHTRGGRNVQRAIEVLTRAQAILPDSALLVASHANIVECHSSRPSDAVLVLERFVSRSPNTLGYVLLQRLSRKYRGIREARAVFARARRSLRIREEDAPCGGQIGGCISPKVGDGGNGKDGGKDGGSEDDIKGRSGNFVTAGGIDGDQGHNGGKTGESTSSMGSTGDVGRRTARCMVTNRLHPKVGGGGRLLGRIGYKESRRIDDGGISSMTKPRPLSDTINKTYARPGVITWHLYAVHATIEHRLNRSPAVAARVYELGLRKHRTFLSTPPYVLQYANLLLELNDEENLRALLTRAVAACEEAAINVGSGVVFNNDPNVNAAQDVARRERQRSLWDMMLQFESMLSSLNRSGDAVMVQSIETRRRRALYGPGREDVGGGGLVGSDVACSEVGEEGDNIGIGVQKSTLGEQLVRSDGYDIASRIINGLSRLVDTLEVTGALGNCGACIGRADAATAAISAVYTGFWNLWADDFAGGPSDASYQRRLRFAQDSRARAASLSVLGTAHGGGIGTTGTTSVAVGAPGGGTSAGVAAGKLLTAREKFAQSGTNASGGAVTSAAVAATSPEWLRSLLLALPSVPRPAYRGAPTAKPPPHMIEMALASLRANSLPPRPTDDGGISMSGIGTVAASGKTVTSPLKRRFEETLGDSSDEENGGMSYGSGYGNQFRSRQRARQVMLSSIQPHQQQGAGVLEGNGGGGPS
uniref:Suppressor of forked domain-containing protein n=1 Tax=Ditylum brightwellii TaxID=49249 RepID=A0A7S2EH36_9STRA|mmetsp:Transcript_29085/g.43254  ORF Transcript_29085/g.43254 Transcript_29085/m.43254 type:complete len:1248 (+) Transcript_29085:51-3794(+)